MQSTTEVRSLLASYERTITANEKAGVTSRMFLNNIAKQPSSFHLKARSRPSSCRNPRPTESPTVSPPPARVTTLLNSAGQSSRFQLTRSSSARCVRPTPKVCASEGPPSALEHQLRKHGSRSSTGARKSDATISTAGSSFIADEDTDDAIRSFLNESLDLDDGSDDEHNASGFSSFKQMDSSAPAMALRQSPASGRDVDATNVPLSLRSFHRSSSLRSLRSNEDEDSTGFKFLVHREIGVVDDDVSTADSHVPSSVKRLRKRIDEPVATRDPTPVKQNSSRSILSAKAGGNAVGDELGISSCHSTRVTSRRSQDGKRSSPTKERNATPSSNSGTRSSRGSSASKSESADGRLSRDDGDDLDAASRHSVSVRTVRRSKPTSAAQSSDECECENAQKKKRSSSSTSKSLSSPSNDFGTTAGGDGGSKTSLTSKYARRKAAAPTGRSSTRCRDDAAASARDSRRQTDEKRLDRKSAENSKPAGGTCRPSRTRPRSTTAGATLEASPTSPSSSHNGSWTLSFDNDDVEIDLSPGTLGLSSKPVSGHVAPDSLPLSSHHGRSSTMSSSRRKVAGPRRTSPPKKAASRSSPSTASSPESEQPSMARRTGTTSSASKAARSRVPTRTKFVSAPLLPSPPPNELPKPTCLERRRQRYLERANAVPSSD